MAAASDAEGLLGRSGALRLLWGGGSRECPISFGGVVFVYDTV